MLGRAGGAELLYVKERRGLQPGVSGDPWVHGFIHGQQRIDVKACTGRGQNRSVHGGVDGRGQRQMCRRTNGQGGEVGGEVGGEGRGG